MVRSPGKKKTKKKSLIVVNVNLIIRRNAEVYWYYCNYVPHVNSNIDLSNNSLSLLLIIHDWFLQVCLIC